MTERMRYRPLTALEIQAIEAKVDAFFLQRTMPGRSKGEARWKVLTAAEDALRLIFAEKSAAWLDPTAFDDRASFVIMMDRYKYSLKYSLDLIEKSNLEDKKIDIKKFGEDGNDYLIVNHLLHIDASLYADAVGTFTSIWTGNRVAYGKPNRNKIFLHTREREIQYGALELLTAKQVDDFNPIAVLGAVFAASTTNQTPMGDSIEWGQSIKDIVSSTKSRSGSVSYQFVSSRGKDLYQFLMHDPNLLPNKWNFPWGNYEESVRFSTALLSVCSYHLIAIYFGAAKHSVVGVGINEAGLMITSRDLSRRISSISNLSLEQSAKIIDALTYGRSVKSPDPALQPFVPIHSNLIFVPCMMVLTNQWSRNMLSLHARVDSRTFDSQSAIFEEIMVSDILGSSNGYTVIPNKTFNAENSREEIDLLYIDHENLTILVCELKWSIPPGDPREVYNRRSSINEKIKQVMRKSEFVKKNIGKILNKISVNFMGENWSVLDCVIVDGYRGHPSPQRNTPIVPQAIFIQLLQIGNSIGDIHSILSTPLWLPRPGVDISFERKSDHIGPVEIEDVGFSMMNDQYLEREFPRYVQDALMYSEMQRASLEW